MSTPAKGFVVPDCPVTATESVEKSALLASEGRVAPVAPVLLPASAVPARAAARRDSGRRPGIAPHRACLPAATLARLAGASRQGLRRVSGGTREAKVRAKSACWFTGVAVVGLSSATLVSGPKAASSVLSTYRPLVGMVIE
jgi:hypothetical protein